MKATTATTTTKTTMCGVQSENNCKKCNYEKHDNSSSYSYDFNYNYKNNNNNNNNIQTKNKNNDYKNNYYKKKSHKYKQRNSRLGGRLNKKTFYKTTFDKTTTILTNIRKRRRITTEAASFNGISEVDSTLKISPASSVNPSTSDSIASSATDALSGVLNLFHMNATLLTAAAISAATSAATTPTTTTLPTTTTDFYALFDDADSDATILRDVMNTTSEIKINIDIDNSNNSNSNSNNFSTTSLNDTRIEYIFDNNYVRILFIVLYTMCFCCCVFGNLLVILVVTCSRRLRSITNFFLANLAVADFCVGVFCVMQNLSIYLIDSWVFGEFLCRMYQFVHSLSYTASIFILVVICTERYFAIVHPITCKQILTAARLRMVIVTVWITAAVYSTPKFIFSKTIENIHEDGHKEEICVLDRKMYNSKLLDMISFVLLYAIPLMVMTVLYSKIAITLWRSSRGWSQHIAQQHDNDSGLHNMYQNQTQHNQQHNNHHQLQQHHTALQLQQQQKQHHPLTNSSSSSSSTPTTASMLSRKQSSTAAYEKRCVSITESQDDSFEVSLESDRPVVSTCRSSKSSFYHHHNHHQVQHQPQPPHHHHLHQPRHGAQRAASHMSHSSSNVLRARRGVVRMLIIFVLTFAICNLPIHARKMWQYWGQSYRGDSNFNALLTPLTFLCSYFNSGVNPLLYAFLSRNFRKGMKELLMCSWKKSKNKSSSNSSMHHKRIALQTHSLPTDTTHIGTEQL